jgi:circadian clock protein KaiC
LLRIHKLVEELKPKVVVFDPLTTFLSLGDKLETRSMLTRLIDFLKSHQITAIFNSLTEAGGEQEQTEMGVSSLMDTWILLRNFETNGERNRLLYVLKARGIAHSNQVREFVLTDRGIELVEAYLGAEGALTGSARVTLEAKEKDAARSRQETIERVHRELGSKRKALEAQIAALRAQFEAESQDIEKEITQQKQREQLLENNRAQMAKLRGSNGASSKRAGSRA